MIAEKVVESRRDLVWTLHHKGWSVSQISRQLRMPPDEVRRVIDLRWALDMGSPKEEELGRDSHEDRRPDAATGGKSLIWYSVPVEDVLAEDSGCDAASHESGAPVPTDNLGD